MSTDPTQIREEIARTRASLSDNVDALADQANPAHIAQRQVSKLKDGGSRLLDRVFGAAEDAGDAARDGLQQAGDALEGGVHKVGDAVGAAPRAVRRQSSGNPVAAGLVAFGVGLLIAAAFPASRAEQDLAEAVKEKAEPVTEEVVAAAKEVAANLSEPVQEAVQSLQERAGEAVENVRAEGADAAAEVKQVAQDSAAAVGEATRESAQEVRQSLPGDGDTA